MWKPRGLVPDGVFAICSFVMHNFVNLNIRLKAAIEQGIAYFVNGPWWDCDRLSYRPAH